jgi:hypothetical protein
MKKKYILTPLFLLLTALFINAQVGTNFNEPNGGTDHFVDSDVTTHTLVNNGSMGTVSHSFSSGELGFSTSFTPTRNNTNLGVVGLSDGDYVGVYSGSTIPATSSDISSWTLGNAYVIDDPDGMLTVEFDKVSLVGAVNPRFQMKIWIDDTSYEFSDDANDRVLIKLDIDNGASEVIIIDTDGGVGNDLNNYLYNGNSVLNVITDIDIDLSANIGSTVKLIIEADFNASSEQLTFDSIMFTSGMTLSVPDYELEKTINLYPNPSNNYIIISGLSKIESYTIYSVIGSKIVSGNISNNKKIDIRNFTNGLYFLKFDNGNTIKFLKE